MIPTIDVFHIVLATLAVYRLTMLFTEDLIMEPWREFWQRRYPVANFYYDEAKVVTTDATALTGFVRVWPFKREVVFNDGFWLPAKTYRIGVLIECFYCVSMWMALGVTFATYRYMGIDCDWQFVLNFLGIAGGAEIINNVFSRE